MANVLCHAPAANRSTNADGVRALGESSVGLGRLTVSEEARVVHVLVGVAVFGEACRLQEHCWEGKVAT